MNNPCPASETADSKLRSSGCISFDIVELWLEPPSPEMATAFHQHLSHCSGCLRKWITLEAAADMAGISVEATTPIDRSPGSRA